MNQLIFIIEPDKNEQRIFFLKLFFTFVQLNANSAFGIVYNESHLKYHKTNKQRNQSNGFCVVKIHLL